MDRPQDLWRRLRTSIGRGRRERDLDAELEFHLAMEASAQRERGLSDAQARREARRRLGGAIQVKEAVRSEWRHAWVDAVARDLRFGLRQLRRAPLFSLAIVLTLAVGIGATTTVFTAIDGILLRPLPYPQPERILTLWEVDSQRGEDRLEVSPGNFYDWRERNTTFSTMALLEPSGVDFELAADLAPLFVKVWRASEGFFEVMGATPHLGSVPESGDYVPNAEPVVVLSYAFWTARLAGDPDIVGSTIRLDDEPVRVSAVMGPEFDYPPGRQMWVPMPPEAWHTGVRTGNWMRVVGRLANDVSQPQAQADLDRVSSEIAIEHPESTGRGVRAVPLPEVVLGEARPVLWILFAGVALLLVVACANVANLLLVRATSRGREIALRRALGATRGRVVRQHLTETLGLCLVAGLLGVVLAYCGLRGLLAASPPQLPRLEHVQLDWISSLFALLLSGVALALCGVLPALRGSRVDTRPALEAAAATTTGSRSRWRAQGLLAAAQVAVAVVLLAAGGLLLRSFRGLLDRDLGFVVESRGELQVFLWDLLPTAQQRMDFMRAAVEGLESIPGVVGAAAVSALPLHPEAVDPQDDVTIHGRPSDPQQRRFAHTTVATPGYFEVMGIPLREGRHFDDRDVGGGRKVALVNETMARRYWPGESPVGARISFGVMAAPSEWEVVGVVGAVRPGGFESEPRPEVFVPFDQAPIGSMTLVFDSLGGEESLLDAASEVIWELVPRQSIYHAATLDSLLDRTLVQRRFMLVLLLGLAAIATLVATLGVYALMSFAMTQRTMELGVRKALGARESDLVRLGLTWAGAWTGCGLAAGLAAALTTNRVLRAWLVQVEPADPVNLAGVLVVLGLVALGAAYVPARRAATVDPVRALRWE